jgi:hypothetical protein
VSRAKKIAESYRFFLTQKFIKTIPLLAATLRLQHRCPIDRENRQNGNQESSEESRQEGSQKEVVQPKGKANGGRLKRPPFCVCKHAV